MPGITRIHIVSDWSEKNDWRLQLARAHEATANRIYQIEFARIGMDLAPGIVEIECTKEEAAARYDWSEGIDVILKTITGARMTLQEKCLTFARSTVTFEERKNSGAPGAWFYCTAQYYFVGYTRQYWDELNRRLFKNARAEFQDWMLVDFPATRRADAAKSIRWAQNQNEHDGRKATFRYVAFDAVPPQCVVARCAAPSGSAPVSWPWLKWNGEAGPGPCPKCTARDYWRSPKNQKFVCRNCSAVVEV